MDPSTTRSGKKFSSNEPKSNPDDIAEFVSLNINDNNAVSHADKQAESLHRFSLIADKIYPRLALDGNNFMSWSCNLLSTWNNYFFDDPNYFDITTRDSDYRRNLVALTFIRNSVDRSLYKSITSALVTPNARTTFQALKKRFCKASWSSIIWHAEILFNPPDRSTKLTSHAIALQHAINNIESQIGTMNSKTILTLSLFFSARQLHEPLLNALESRKAVNPSLVVHAKDILDIANRVQQHPAIDSSSNITLSRMDANTNTPDRSRQSKSTPKTSRGPSLAPSTPTPSSNSIDRKPDKWKKKWLTKKNPCFYCGQVGHWLPNCPTKAMADRMKHQRRQNVVVASIGAMPLPGCGDALLDSGATHSVVGDLSFFTTLSLTDLTLSVASNHRFPIGGIGTVRLLTPNGPITLSNVLYCKHIPGVVISLGQLFNDNIHIFFSNGLFLLRHNSIFFHTRYFNHQWFLPIQQSSSNSFPSIQPIALSQPPPINLSTRPISSDTCSALEVLWHRWIGHLSLRNLRRLRQFDAATGIPSHHMPDVKLCHHCSVSKSKHRPVQAPSRGSIRAPGDLIVADLIGPLPCSIDSKRYVLVIQDFFTRLTTAIPIPDKAEAKTQLRNWMNHFFNEFLLKHGVEHEYSMPYEHHQNGRIERTNRTLSEIARTCLIGANLPVKLWSYAFKHAMWIFNRTLHFDCKQTPYELISKQKPSFHLLKVFGAKAYIYDHTFRKDFSPHGFVGYHLGIASDSKGWLFWCPEKNTVIRSASAKFDESSFFAAKPDVSSIQALNLLDDVMIKELATQDRMISTITSFPDPVSIHPTHYRDIINSPEQDSWLLAVKEELSSMNEQDVFDVIEMRDALRMVKTEDILSTRWVFTKKHHPDRFKARLVARGFRQTKDINFSETFAPTPTFGALRLLLAISCDRKWPIRTFDVKVAFLHSLIDMPVYVWPPQGMAIDKFKVLKLKKALYGTKQAARCWWLHLTGILRNIGFSPNDEDPSTYTLNCDRGQALLWIHVDDGAITASSQDLMDSISMKLSSHLKIKWDKEVSGLVGLNIEPYSGGYYISQAELINKIINLRPSNITARSPIPPNTSLTSGSRPDITYAVNYLARFSLCTNQSHWQVLEHLIAYLRYTPRHGIRISAATIPRGFECYVDADCGGEGDRSCHGFILLYNGNPISWQSKRQVTVASSTCQAEYIAMSFASKECLWLSHLFLPVLGRIIPKIYSDNKAAISIADNTASRKQTQHLIREFNLINEYIVTKKIELSWVSTHDQLADIFTKALGQLKINSFIKAIGSRDAG
ncbi:hypothetical protein O181_078047 [Austropuccinia psidii MF-1]|uniref:Gag-Pol-p199 n=1 Tax=Austropuccinia psidii MF-1 TaxID=1389203 RepID=A0A9Q3IF87_9BASI|nr:hypothetical protein [Austropuccinia psidii MF-1]